MNSVKQARTDVVYELTCFADNAKNLEIHLMSAFEVSLVMYLDQYSIKCTGRDNY